MRGLIGATRRTLTTLLRTRGRELGLVAGLFLMTAIYLAIQVLRVKSYAWMVDELLYTKAAQGFASSPIHPQIFGEPYPVPNALYARLLALPYGLISNLHAFQAGHLMNALIFASTSIPVYLLARRVGATQVYALVGAALAVWIPWAVATLVLMSESLAYPAFAWAVLAAVVAIADPRPRNDVLLVVAMLALVYSRTQFIVVLPAFAIALVAHEIAWPARAPGELVARARRHWALGAFIALALFVWLVLSPAFLGNYARTTQVPRFPALLLDSMADHLSHVILGVGVVPAFLWFVAIVRGASAPERREQHIFAYLSGLGALLLVYQAGFYSRQIAGGNLQERYMFYIAALFAVGAALTLSARARPAPIGSLTAAAAVSVLVLASANYPPDVTGVRVIESGASGFNNQLIAFAGWLAKSWTVNGALGSTAAALAVVVAAAIWPHRWQRLTAAALAAAALVFCALETNAVLTGVIPQVNSQIPTALGHPPKAWVDGLLYKGDDSAGAIEGQVFGDQQGLWEWAEFWNSRIKRVYALPGQIAYSALPTTPMTVDPVTGRISTPVEMPTLVVSAGEPALKVRGQEIRTIITGQRLIRPQRPYRADFLFGNGAGSALTKKPTALSLYPPRPGATSVRVTFDLLPAELPGKPSRARWIAASDTERRTGEARQKRVTHVALAARLAPGASRAVVSLTAPDTRKQTLLTIANVNVYWQ